MFLLNKYEIFNGNKNYEKYKKVGAVTSYFHLYELYYNLKKEHEEKIFYDYFLLSVIPQGLALGIKP